MNKIKRRILLTYDGSELALDATRYVAAVMPANETEVTLFYVGTELSESFWSHEKDMDFRYKMTDIRACMTMQQKHINASMNQAREILINAGFADEMIQKKMQPKNLGIMRDILAEYHEGYDAIVMGRSGHSKLKDILVGSVPSRIIGKIQGIPLIVVGGPPKQNRILVSFDGSREILKAINYIIKLLDPAKCKVMICHALLGHSIFQEGDEEKWQDSEKKLLEPLIAEVKEFLTDSGFPFDNVASEVVTDRVSRANAIVQKAIKDEYNTIVVGRRGLTVIKEVFMGRVGHKIFQLAGDRTVWIIR